MAFGQRVHDLFQRLWPHIGGGGIDEVTGRIDGAVKPLDAGAVASFWQNETRPLAVARPCQSCGICILGNGRPEWLATASLSYAMALVRRAFVGYTYKHTWSKALATP